MDPAQTTSDGEDLDKKLFVEDRTLKRNLLQRRLFLWVSGSFQQTGEMSSVLSMEISSSQRLHSPPGNELILDLVFRALAQVGYGQGTVRTRPRELQGG